MRRRQRHVSIWMSEEEYRQLKTQAEIAGMGVDPFVRNLVAGVQLKPKPSGEYGTLIRELAAIGNNINQIAHWANARKSIYEPEIVEAAMLANEAWRLVKDKM